MKIISKTDIRVPPPVVTLFFGTLMYGLSLVCAWNVIFAYQGLLALFILFIAILFLLPAVVQFIQQKTTVNPLRPERASKLVVNGLYRFSRNPMYLGMAMVLVAWAVHLGNPLNLVVLIGFIVYMNRFQIRIEEQALEKLFGEAFLRYKARVRRWV